MWYKPRILLLLLWVAVAVAIATFFYMYNPTEQPQYFAPCLFRNLTGYQCPGCGGQRAVHALLHGHWHEAWHFNALFVALLPLILLYAGLRAGEWLTGKAHPLSHWPVQRILVVTGIVLLVFGIWRNL
jgi:Protein of unknown function (DUF2752)